MELKKIKCPTCGGELDIPEDSDEMKCNFCGSKVIIDDKATEVGRIKKAEIKAKKELDEHELENRKKNDSYNDEREYKKKKNTGKLKGWAIAMTILCLLFSINAFTDGRIISGLIGLIQVVAFGYATLLCLDVLPEKMKNLHKIVFIGGCLLFIPMFAIGNTQPSSSSYYEAEDLLWDEYVLSEKLPKPKTLKGKLNYDSSSSLSIYIMNVDKNEYNDYVVACKDKGYTVDIYNSSNAFGAKNEEGYSLNLYYSSSDKKYSITLNEPNTDTNDETTNEEAKEDTKTNENSNEKSQPSTNNGLRSDFKQAMDDYESFMNEYVDFMKRYNSNPSDISLLADYADYLTKYTKALDSFDKWESEDMNEEETKYYIEVQNRINQKLLEIQ